MNEALDEVLMTDDHTVPPPTAVPSELRESESKMAELMGFLAEAEEEAEAREEKLAALQKKHEDLEKAHQEPEEAHHEIQEANDHTVQGPEWDDDDDDKYTTFTMPPKRKVKTGKMDMRKTRLSPNTQTPPTRHSTRHSTKSSSRPHPHPHRKPPPPTLL